MKRVISFLHELYCHNNREWFLAHKAEYLEVKGIFDAFVIDLLKEIQSFDDSIGPLTLRDMTYRIYRDVRFSKNKAPYKCHMGVYICRGGKKSGYSGYYFQVSGADDCGWEGTHMLAAGDYWCDPKVLKILREDIELGKGDFREALSKADGRFALDTEDSLKKVPNGFPKDSPDAEYFKLKKFCLCWEPDEEFVTAPDLASRVAGVFRTSKPFLDYVNRAVEYVKEEMIYD